MTFDKCASYQLLNIVYNSILSIIIIENFNV